MAGKIRLGDLLVRAGVLDELKLKAALAEQQRWGGRLGRILVDMNFVSEDLLTKALSKQLGFPRATFSEMNIPAAVLAKVPADFARSNACCPEHYDPVRKLLTVAMADPTNVPVADELRFKTGLRVEATIAGEVQISRAIDQLYGTRSGGYAAELPAAIDLPPDDERPIFSPSQAYVAAMAASGLAIDSTQSPPGWPPQTGPQAMQHGAPMHPAPMQSSGSIPPIQSSGSLPPMHQSGSLPPHAVHTTGPLDLNRVTGTLDGPSSNGYRPAVPNSPVPISNAHSMETMDGVTRRLEAAQRQQHRAVQVMIDLLIEKGVFSRDEFAQLINRRGQ